MTNNNINDNIIEMADCSVANVTVAYKATATVAGGIAVIVDMIHTYGADGAPVQHILNEDAERLNISANSMRNPDAKFADIAQRYAEHIASLVDTAVIAGARAINVEILVTNNLHDKLLVSGSNNIVMYAAMKDDWRLTELKDNQPSIVGFFANAGVTKSGKELTPRLTGFVKEDGAYDVEGGEAAEVYAFVTVLRELVVSYAGQDISVAVSLLPARPGSYALDFYGPDKKKDNAAALAEASLGDKSILAPLRAANERMEDFAIGGKDGRLYYAHKSKNGKVSLKPLPVQAYGNYASPGEHYSLRSYQALNVDEKNAYWDIYIERKYWLHDIAPEKGQPANRYVSWVEYLAGIKFEDDGSYSSRYQVVKEDSPYRGANEPTTGRNAIPALRMLALMNLIVLPSQITTDILGDTGISTKRSGKQLKFKQRKTAMVI